MNIEHHAEQMEAMRLEFAKLWEHELEPRALNLGVQRRHLIAIQDIAWQAFRIARAKRDEPCQP